MTDGIGLSRIGLFLFAAGALQGCSAQFSNPFGNGAGGGAGGQTLQTVNGFSVTIEQSVVQADPATALPVSWEISFAETIDPLSFDVTDIVQTGTAGGVTWVITDMGNQRDFVLRATGLGTEGTLVPTLAAAAAATLAGNTSAASTSTDNSVTYDTVGPTVTVNQAAAQADPTNALAIA
ncbi:MAG: hypothetical protein IT285_08645, partial [Bdellovibrionales bacterium]|nr:hypothetical protein [Bdellovibrionales bacterium]